MEKEEGRRAPRLAPEDGPGGVADEGARDADGRARSAQDGGGDEGAAAPAAEEREDGWADCAGGLGGAGSSEAAAVDGVAGGAGAGVAGGDDGGDDGSDDADDAADPVAAEAGSACVVDGMNVVVGTAGSRSGAPVQISAGEKAALQGIEELRRLIKAS